MRKKEKKCSQGWPEIVLSFLSRFLLRMLYLCSRAATLFRFSSSRSCPSSSPTRNYPSLFNSIRSSLSPVPWPLPFRVESLRVQGRSVFSRDPGSNAPRDTRNSDFLLAPGISSFYVRALRDSGYRFVERNKLPIRKNHSREKILEEQGTILFLERIRQLEFHH